MPLFEIQPEATVAVPTTTFAVEQILERPELQRAHVEAIGVYAPLLIPGLKSVKK